MKESDIRSPDIVKEHLKREREWMAQFEDETGLVKNDFTVMGPCPCCGKNNFKYLLKKWSFKLVTCLVCSTIFANPKFTPEMLDLYYNSKESREKYHELLTSGSSNTNRLHKIFLPRRNFIEKKILEKGKKIQDIKLLDIGCASGQFLSVFDKKNSPSLFGIEANSNLAQEAEKLVQNAKIINSTIETAVLEPEFFDVVTVWETLEHLFDPFLFLKQIVKILKKDGLCFMSFPNIEGFDIQILWDKGEAFSPPSHLNYFRKSTVHKLFERAGLKLDFIVTPGILDVDIIRNRIDRHPDIKKRLGEYWTNILKNDTEENEILREKLQSLITENGLSSNMMVVCYKS